MRTCVVCGVSIEGRDPQSSTCGVSCRAHARYARRKAARASSSQARVCARCGAPIIGRAPQARFCSHDCLMADTRGRAKSARLAAKTGRHCKWCGGGVDPTLNAAVIYCCDECRYQAQKKRDREKIAAYRAADPPRYRAHRRIQNERRAQATAALKLIHEIQAKGLEALL